MNDDDDDFGVTTTTTRRTRMRFTIKWRKMRTINDDEAEDEEKQEGLVKEMTH